MNKPLIYGPGGSITCDEEQFLSSGRPITQELKEDSARHYYGGRFFLCETSNLAFAEWVAKSLSVGLTIKPEEKP